MTELDLEYLQRVGVYDPDAGDAEHVRSLLRWLVDIGWRTEEIVDSASACDLGAIAGDHAIRPQAEFTLADAAAQMGVEPEQLDRLRRAHGLAPRGLDSPGYSRAAVEAFRGLQAGAAMFSEDEALHFARVLGSSLARIADAAVSLFLIDIEGPLRDAGGTPLDVARRNLDAAAALDDVAAGLDALLRLHMEDAVRRSRAARGENGDAYTARMAVGFIDLVGFTAFSERVSAVELGLMVRQFESVAYDLVADHGGRVVKLIGDEVMFVSVDPTAACTIAAELISEFRRENVTPRGGLAYGPLLARGGDYYGPIVNLAARIGDLAVPCELLATPELAERVEGFSFEPAGRRQLKGFRDPVLLVSLSC